MKMHAVTAAVLAVLASPVVLAASEGADTWSAVQSVQKSAYAVLESAPRADPPALFADNAFDVSEGGDTWSSVQASGVTSAQVAEAPANPGQADVQYAGAFGGSEGGDTWSRFVPQLQSQPTGSVNVASARNRNIDR